MFLKKNCRGCGSEKLFEIFDFGEQCLANDLRHDNSIKNDTFPLRLVFCQDCSLSQIDVDVPPERLFENYNYFSSFSSTMRQHARKLANDIIVERSLNESSLVIEAASNDGYLLKNYKAKGIQVLGVEPASNIARVAEEKNGISTVTEFFCEDLGEKLASSNKKCDVFHAHNVFAHVPDPGDFLRGVAKCLKEDGVAIIEAPYIVDLVERCEFDTVYHEHYSYFSLSAVDTLARNNGLSLIKAERVSIHGGSVRYFLSLETEQNDEIIHALKTEKQLGVCHRGYYENFATDVKKVLQKVEKKIFEVIDAGHTLAIYGASAKGSTFLQTLGANAFQHFDFAVDISPYKQGKFLPGTDIKIYPPQKLNEMMPDYTMLLSWNFADEIISQQRGYLNAGGKIIIPLPEIEVIST